MTINRWHTLLLSIIWVTGPLLGQGQAAFVENRGQWKGDFDYRLELSNGAMFFEKEGWRFHFLNPPHRHKGEQHHRGKSAERIISSAVAMEFAGGAPSTRLIAEEPLSYYYHYLQAGKEDQANIRPQQRLRYQEIYPGVSAQIYQQGSKLKYDLLLEDPERAQQIRMVYRGQESLSLQNGKLIIETALGKVMESIPLAYQEINGKRIPLSCKYRLDGNTVYFVLADFKKGHPAVIDPVLEFASFSGSGDLNFGNSATPGEAGSVYGAGVNFGVNYPSTVGSVQERFAGDSIFNADITISKFSADGSRLLYASYLGGSDVDIVHSIVMDQNEDLLLLGLTGSADFPITQGAFQDTFSGGPRIPSFAYNDFDYGTDLFISRISADGTKLKSSTFWGGRENDGYNLIHHNYGDHFRGEIEVDAAGNILVSSSSSSLDIPLLNNLGDPASGNKQLAVLGKFSSDLSQQVWGRSYHGNGHTAGYALAIREQKVYLTGGTKSTNLPGTSQGYRSTSLGDLDGYVAAFSLGNGQLEQATYYGTPEYDQSFILDTDRFGDVYLFGQTKGQLNTSQGLYENPGSTQFVCKLDSNLSALHWQTSLGSGQAKQDLVPSAFMVDDCQHIYLSGWNGKANMVGFPAQQNGDTKGLSVSTDAYQSNTDGSDFYFMVLGRDASTLLYASYVGGNDNEHVDGGTSRFSKDGTIYQAVCSNCNSQGFPTTPGAYAPQAGSNTCNMAVFKFSFDQVIEADAGINYTLGIDSICDGLVVNFKNESKRATHYKWIFPNGDTSNLFEPRRVFRQLGKYQIKLVAYDSICGLEDTTEIEIDHTTASRPEAEIEAHYEPCDQNFEIQVNAALSKKAHHYLWDFGDGTQLDGQRATYNFQKGGHHELMMVAMDTVCFRSDTSFYQIFFRDTITPPKAAVNTSLCGKGIVEILMQHQKPWYQYHWTTDLGQFEGAQPAIQFNTAGKKQLQLEITDTLCNRTFRQQFELDIKEIERGTFIPNAFTPNDDGLNDSYKLFGDLCAQVYRFQIFNRWGELVFQTDQPFHKFWDGKLPNGSKAPGGVYSYVLVTADQKLQGSFNLVR